MNKDLTEEKPVQHNRTELFSEPQRIIEGVVSWEEFVERLLSDRRSVLRVVGPWNPYGVSTQLRNIRMYKIWCTTLRKNACGSV